MSNLKLPELICDLDTYVRVNAVLNSREGLIYKNPFRIRQEELNRTSHMIIVKWYPEWISDKERRRWTMIIGDKNVKHYDK